MCQPNDCQGDKRNRIPSQGQRTAAALLLLVWQSPADLPDLPASLCVLPGTSLGRYLLDPLAEGVPIDASPRVCFAWEKEVPCWVTVLRRRGVLPAGCAKQINRNTIDGQNRNDHHNALSL